MIFMVYLVCKAGLTHKEGQKKMGYRLKEIREEKGLTQERLEELSGVSRQTISAIENNTNYQAKSGTLLALANAMGITVDKIFFVKAV